MTQKLKIHNFKSIGTLTFFSFILIGGYLIYSLMQDGEKGVFLNKEISSGVSTIGENDIIMRKIIGEDTLDKLIEEGGGELDEGLYESVTDEIPEFSNAYLEKLKKIHTTNAKKVNGWLKPVDKSGFGKKDKDKILEVKKELGEQLDKTEDNNQPLIKDLQEMLSFYKLVLPDVGANDMHFVMQEFVGICKQYGFEVVSFQKGNASPLNGVKLNDGTKIYKVQYGIKFIPKPFKYKQFKGFLKKLTTSYKLFSIESLDLKPDVKNPGFIVFDSISVITYYKDK